MRRPSFNSCSIAKEEEASTDNAASSLQAAIKVILIADLVMSLDNVLALAAIAQTVPGHKYSLILVGLATSIPIVVFGAQILVKLMDKFPIIIYFGAGILAYAASEMIISDKSIGIYLLPYKLWVQLGMTFGVIAIGYFKKRGHASTPTKQNN